jgi:hypothetical protein
MGHSYVPRNPRGQQRDKLCREALRLELAALGEGNPLKKLRQIARKLIEKADACDLPAVKELFDRMDGKPAITAEIQTEQTHRYVVVVPSQLGEEEWVKQYSPPALPSKVQ